MAGSAYSSYPVTNIMFVSGSLALIFSASSRPVIPRILISRKATSALLVLIHSTIFWGLEKPMTSASGFTVFTKSVSISKAKGSSSAVIIVTLPLLA